MPARRRRRRRGAHTWRSGTARAHSWSAGPRARRAARRARRRGSSPAAARRYDAFIVGYPGHFDLPAARRAARGRPVVFNPLVSLADTLVGDRRRFRPGSLAARVLARDRPARIPQRRPRRRRHATRTRSSSPSSAGLAVVSRSASSAPRSGCSGRTGHAGARSRALRRQADPAAGHRDDPRGSARSRPTIRFRIVGSGQLEHAARATARRTSSTFRGSSTSGCREELAAAGCALGIFGTTAKARRVIPNKAFQALACGHAARHCGHARRAGAARRTRRAHCSCRPAIQMPSPKRFAASPVTPSSHATSAQRGRVRTSAMASEEVLGPRWRSIIERLA